MKGCSSGVLLALDMVLSLDKNCKDDAAFRRHTIAGLRSLLNIQKEREADESAREKEEVIPFVQRRQA